MRKYLCAKVTIKLLFPSVCLNVPRKMKLLRKWISTKIKLKMFFWWGSLCGYLKYSLELILWIYWVQIFWSHFLWSKHNHITKPAQKFLPTIIVHTKKWMKYHQEKNTVTSLKNPCYGPVSPPWRLLTSSYLCILSSYNKILSPLSFL